MFNTRPDFALSPGLYCEVVRNLSFSRSAAEAALTVAAAASTPAELKSARAVVLAAGVCVGQGYRGTVAQRAAALTARIVAALTLAGGNP